MKWVLYVIATDPVTITTIQRVGFAFREPGLFHKEDGFCIRRLTMAHRRGSFSSKVLAYGGSSSGGEVVADGEA